jgi:hypothetical protein
MRIYLVHKYQLEYLNEIHEGLCSIIENNGDQGSSVKKSRNSFYD